MNKSISKVKHDMVVVTRVLLGSTVAVLCASLAFNNIAIAQSSNEVLSMKIDRINVASVEERWQSVKQAVLGDISLIDGSEILRIEVPERAYDAANVPVTINALQLQTEERYIKELYIIADKNPAPVAGKFMFKPNTGWQNLETRIRINEYTHVRAVAIMQDDSAYMVAKFVKASGGCSTPATGAPRSAAEEEGVASSGVGRIKFKLESSPAVQNETERLNVNVQFQHPNTTGMQFDQLSRIVIPAYFIHTIGVKYDEEEIIKLETNFSLSENPALRFDFVPQKAGGEISIYAIDSKLKFFEQQWSS